MEFLKGRRIEISLMSTKVPSDSGFSPLLVLLVPEELNKNKYLPQIYIPKGYSPILFNDKKPVRASFEPFSPGWFYELADKSIAAPKDGIYYIAIYDKTGFSGEMAITILTVIAGLIPGFLILKYATNKNAALTSGRRFRLLMIGLLGLIVWSGALLGSVLVFLAALIPKNTARIGSQY
jgi:hypothetical protein